MRKRKKEKTNLCFTSGNPDPPAAGAYQMSTAEPMAATNMLINEKVAQAPPRWPSPIRYVMSENFDELITRTRARTEKASEPVKNG